MNYNTTINTKTVTHRQTTVHINKIDWDYNFNNPKHTDCLCTDQQGKHGHIQRQVNYLAICEEILNNKNVYASTYGGWPRIWEKVVGVGMVSAWPYWEPRPMVQVIGTLGYTWEDWNHLTGAEIR